MENAPRNISKEKLSSLEFHCPLKNVAINFTFDLIEIRTRITDGKFGGAQIGVQCAACGMFHLGDEIPVGFLVLRNTLCRIWDVETDGPQLPETVDVKGLRR